MVKTLEQWPSEWRGENSSEKYLEGSWDNSLISGLADWVADVTD